MTLPIQIVDRAAGRHLSVAASRGDVLVLIAKDRGFRSAFSKSLIEAPFNGFFWEVAPASAATLGRPFECMVVPSNAVGNLRADRRPFSEFIKSDADSVVRRSNLGGDAELVIPTDSGAADYAHLGAFLRSAAAIQIDDLWRVTGEAALEWVERSPDRPLWISTSGLGVAWLHIRLDSRPKYYSYAPYREANA